MPHTSNNWQSNTKYLPTRRMMMQKLIRIMLNRQSLSPLDHASYQVYLKKLPLIVRRIELALYTRAASLDEYLNTSTLQRRVQFLLVTLHHQRTTSGAVSRNDVVLLDMWWVLWASVDASSMG